MSNFSVLEEPMQGLKLLRRLVHSDSRGTLDRVFSAEDFLELGSPFQVEDINVICISRPGTVKGMHFQLHPYTESKLVTCLSGEVFDVVVDLRRSSKTFGEWFGVHLTAAQPISVVVPTGFAHGMQALSPKSVVNYCHTSPYRPKHESGLNPLDSSIGIRWPTAVVGLSSRDQALPNLAEIELDFL